VIEVLLKMPMLKPPGYAMSFGGFLHTANLLAVTMERGDIMIKACYINEIFCSMVLGLVFPCILLFNPNVSSATPLKTTIPFVVDSQYEIQILVPGSHFHGIHGLTFDSQDNLYAGSVIGRAIYYVNTNTGEVKEFIGPPDGMADDVEFGPDGRIYYTSILEGKLRCKGADGKVTILAEGLPGINALAFNNEGRLFATQVFMGDALYEIDLSGQKKNRKIAEKLGGLNGFDFGPDNMLYGPLWFKGVIAKVNVATGKVDVVASDFKKPGAVNFDSRGNLFALDSATSEVVQVDVKTGQKMTIAKLEPSLDNLAIDSMDRIFITNFSKNGIYEIDKKTGKARTIIEGKLSCAAGVAVSTEGGSDTVYITDVFSLKKVDGFTGEVITLKSSHAEGSHIAYPMTISAYKDNLLLIGPGTGTVQVIDRKTNQSKSMYAGFKRPSHALMMDDGSIIVAEMGTGNLLRVKGEEGKDRTVIATDLIVPGYISRAGNSAVYITEIGAGTVSRIDLSNGKKKIIAKGLKVPKGIGVLPDGKLVVVETETAQLVQIDPASGAISTLVKNLAVGYPPGSPPPGLVTGVAVSGSGVIYVTGDVENVLYKVRLK
jgi:sugar lactone lactonase YvrE